MIDNSLNLYYIRNFPISKPILLTQNIDNDQKDFSLEIRQIYLLLSQDIEKEIERKFNATPQQIKQDIEDAKNIFNGSVNGVLNIEKNGFGAVSELDIEKGINKFKALADRGVPSQQAFKNLQQELQKQIPKFLDLLDTDFFKTDNIERIRKSLQINSKTGEPRKENEIKKAMMGIASNIQGSVIENLITKSLSDTEQRIDDIIIKGVARVGTERGLQDRYKKADNIVTLKVRGSDVQLGISAKAYFKESQKSFKAQDSFSLGRYNGAGTFETYLKWLSYKIINNPGTSDGSYRRLMAATLADQALGGEAENRALVLLTVLKEGNGLKASATFLNEIFEQYATEPKSMLASVSALQNIDKNTNINSIDLANVKVKIMAQIYQRQKQKGVI